MLFWSVKSCWVASRLCPHGGAVIQETSRSCPAFPTLGAGGFLLCSGNPPASVPTSAVLVMDFSSPGPSLGKYSSQWGWEGPCKSSAWGLFTLPRLGLLLGDLGAFAGGVPAPSAARNHPS